MGLIAKDTGSDNDFTPVPQGTHLAICNMVVDLGLQETTYNNETKVKHQCFVRWELPHERIEWEVDGQKKEGPMSIGKTYTLSLADKANLRKDLEAWRGKAFTPDELDGFDLFNLLGVGCQVIVTHKTRETRTYANVTGVASWPKGMPRPQVTENPILKYAEDAQADFEKLPEWIRNKIKASLPADHTVNQTDDPGPQGPEEYEADSGVPF